MRLGRTVRSVAWCVGILLLGVAVRADDDLQGISALCAPTSTSLCLSDNRFKVTASWRKLDGSTGQGTAVSLTGDTGYFWFFASSNVETITKVLKFCADPFNSYWVFASGLTNVEVTLTYTDTFTGDVKTYTNPLGTAFLPIQDTAAFKTCSAVPPPQATDVTGSWGASVVAGPSTYNTSLTMVQTGASVTGTVAITGFGSGSLTGSVSGDTLSFTIHEVSPCVGTFLGTATISADNGSATGTLSGSDCHGFVAANLSGTKNFVSGPPPANTADMTGSWNAILNINGSVQAAASMTFVQNGSTVKGTGSVAGAGSGAITGTMTGQSLSFTIHEVSPCQGAFSGTITISADNKQASGTGSGSDCGGNYSAGITATKQ